MHDPSGPESTTPVEVRIAGRSYRLRGSDPDQLRRLAAGVDETLAQIAGPNGSRDDFKVAVLAALNLAAQADEQRQGWAKQIDALRKRAHRLEERLEGLRKHLDQPSAEGD